MLSNAVVYDVNDEPYKPYVDIAFSRCLNYDIDENMIFNKKIIKGEAFMWNKSQRR